MKGCYICQQIKVVQGDVVLLPLDKILKTSNKIVVAVRRRVRPILQNTVQGLGNMIDNPGIVKRIQMREGTSHANAINRRAADVPDQIAIEGVVQHASPTLIRSIKIEDTAADNIAHRRPNSNYKAIKESA